MKRPSLKELNQTVRYASFFDFELTQFEKYLYLISPHLYPLPQNNSPLPPSRLKTKRISQKLFQKAQLVVNFLQKFPTINLVAVTGSLAMENAKKGDDLDFMIITQNNTLWLTRLFVIPLVRLLFKTRHPQGVNRLPGGGRQNEVRPDSPGVSSSGAVCLNLWLDESALSLPQSKRNLYTAHEVLQIKPLFNKGFTYERFIKQNYWTKRYLANFYKYIYSSLPSPAKGRDYEVGVGFVTSFLNLLTFVLQYFYMLPKITSESISLHSAYFHPRSLATKLEHYLDNTP